MEAVARSSQLRWWRGLAAAACLIAGCQTPGTGQDETAASKRSVGVASTLDELVTTTQSGQLEVHVISVGQGDAILIRCPDGNHELLIDAADTRYPGSARQFKDYMRAHQAVNNEIEIVVATHPHADHIGNMAWALREYTVGLYVDNGNVYHTRTYRRVDEAWEDSGAGYWSTLDELVPDVDFCPRTDVTARILRPDGFGEDDDPNNNSVIVRVDYKQDSFLFVGDAEHEEEALLLADAATKALLDTDFLKVGHHGSNTSSGTLFLRQVTPEIVAISCGERGVGTNAGYRHPRHETVTALLGHAGSRDGRNKVIQAYDSSSGRWKSITLNKAVYVTAAEGDLVFESAGQGINKR